MSATRKPLPPPPPAAFTATGKPICSEAIFSASSASATGSVVPGTIGTPAACISSRARVLEPIASIALAGGPMNTTPASRTGLGEGRVLGQEAVPGWIACAPERAATSRIFSMLR